MKRLFIVTLLLTLCVLWWCDTQNNIMKPWTSTSVDTFNEITKTFSWDFTWLNFDVNASNLSWTWNAVKGYAQEYYNDTLSEYVDKAKEWFSWAIQNLKSQYNESVDSLTHIINDKISDSVTEKMDTLKIK